jgi:polysaccharide export outer membrane protein
MIFQVIATALLLLQAPASVRMVQARSTAPLLSQTTSGHAAPGAYVLGAGDVLSVSVIDMPELTQGALKIEPDGTVNLPLLGSLPAAGLTVGQFRGELSQRLTKYTTDPQISLSLAQNGSRFVSVLGEVNAPGVHALDGARTLLELLSLAGGVKADAGPRVIVTRELSEGMFPVDVAPQVVAGHSVHVTIKLDGLMDATMPSDNFLMKPGDTVSVPREQLIYVVGDVHRAGGFPLASHDSMSVLQAISLAEGSSPNAALKSSKILRPLPNGQGTPEQIPVDLKAILAGKAPDQLLYANDVLFVPNSAARSGARRAADVMLQVATGVAIYR